jgi:hypothetical protein
MNTESGIRLIPLFDLVGELAPTVVLGYGLRGERRIVPILTGSFVGPRLKSTPGWTGRRFDPMSLLSVLYFRQ